MKIHTDFKKLLIYNIIITFSFLTSLQLKAQDVTELTQQDYLQLELPPLSVLFENAKNSSNVEFFKTRMEAQERMVQTVKGEWMKNIRAFAGYQYGIIGNNATFTDQNTPQFYQISSSKQSWYNIGVSVSLPMDELFDRKNKIKKYQLEVKATKVEAERWHDEQKIRIIEAYTQAVQFLNVIKIKAEAMIFANAQYKMAENDFINGKLEASGLSHQKSLQTSAVVDYEQTKASLNMSLLQLEVLSETKIINK